MGRRRNEDSTKVQGLVHEPFKGSGGSIDIWRSRDNTHKVVLNDESRY
jgi:hypothetical protein